MPNTKTNDPSAPPEYRIERRGFRIATLPRIGRTPATQKLYAYEGQRDIAIVNAAKELAGIVPGLTRLYQELVPEELANALDAFEPGTGEAAAIGFLLKRGYQIVDKKEDA